MSFQFQAKTYLKIKPFKIVTKRSLLAHSMHINALNQMSKTDVVLNSGHTNEKSKYFPVVSSTLEMLPNTMIPIQTTYRSDFTSDVYKCINDDCVHRCEHPW